ncbi:MAG: hypothetical protein H6977_17740 [Gammaproteobacteria bacterium]|nr:hypothetical protein [Gammaproteobacteria bacterium]
MIGTVILALIFGAAGPAVRADLASTRHNLSVSGPGGFKAASETQTCVFCHAPHNSSPSAPLWNRQSPASTYIPYSSTTALASPGQPDGASLLCLSCHDGSIALGMVLSEDQPIAMAGGVDQLNSGPGYLGTDLSDDHPVSFPYSGTLASTHGELVQPATLTGAVRLDANGELQCTSCHDPHDDTYGMFLVMANTASALCLSCHVVADWNGAAHQSSPATWNGSGLDPWPHTEQTTVAGNACENCHRPHDAGGHQRLLNNASEELNCVTCHDGNVASKNVESEFSKVSNHPVAITTGVHDPTENNVVDARHVECVDCHDPHAANDVDGSVPGALRGVRGITIGGADASPISHEYEVCFRCHGDSPGQPLPPTNRQIVQTNTRLEFDPNNPSHHAVAGPGQNNNVPSLIPPLTTSSVIGCGDCHNNDSGPGAGGTGPAGPHGSSYPSLLERRYVTTDRTPESAAVYAMCYKCHNRNTLLNNPPEAVHKRHVREERTPCNVCHDPHGVSSTQGNPTNNSKLINFDTDVVSTRNGQMIYESLGTNRGRCTLSCHGANHNQWTYP